MTAPADPQADQSTAAQHEAGLVFGRFADVIRRRDGGATRGQPGYVPPLVQQIADRHNADVENRTCDGCGTVGEVGVKPGLVQSEAYIMMAGVCGDCRPRFLGEGS